MKQHQIIYQVLKDADGEWIPSYQIIKTETPYGFLGTSADRIARYMCDSRQACYKEDVERKGEGKFAYYRIKKARQDILI